jgi:hypothetical protein
VTLVCIYFGVWEITKRNGIQPLSFTLAAGSIQDVGGGSSPAPLILTRLKRNRRHYYLWLFGPTLKLPFESRSQWKIQAQVTTVLPGNHFEADYLGSDDGAQVGDRFIVSRDGDYVCRGVVINITRDAAILQKTGWGASREVMIGDEVQGTVHLD